MWCPTARAIPQQRKPAMRIGVFNETPHLTNSARDPSSYACVLWLRSFSLVSGRWSCEDGADTAARWWRIVGDECDCEGVANKPKSASSGATDKGLTGGASGLRSVGFKTLFWKWWTNSEMSKFEVRRQWPELRLSPKGLFALSKAQTALHAHWLHQYSRNPKSVNWNCSRWGRFYLEIYCYASGTQP
jgi:hypothetical protein